MLFLIEIASRRVHLAGCRPHPDQGRSVSKPLRRPGRSPSARNRFASCFVITIACSHAALMKCFRAPACVSCARHFRARRRMASPKGKLTSRSSHVYGLVQKRVGASRRGSLRITGSPGGGRERHATSPRAAACGALECFKADAMGSLSRKDAPRSVGINVRLPPCASAIPRLIDRPSPVP